MILVFGQTGQVARALALLAPDAVYLGRDQADLADADACTQAIRAHAPEAVINAAAFTVVDKAESDEDLAMRINGRAPAAMAETCADLAIPLVHISTDYVFDGSGRQPFRPSDQTGPLGAYGRSKLLGEAGVRAAGGVHGILRTSWVFSAHGGNFVKTMLRLGAERSSLRVVADQIGGPTPARAIAEACLHLVNRLRDDPGLSGLYHFCGAPDTSWADFARAVMAEAGLSCKIEDIPTSVYPTPARRPLNSRLDCSSLGAIGLTRPDWRVDLQKVIKELENNS